METLISIAVDCIRLEAFLNPQPTGKAVIVTHPHPLYGGNMENSVVKTIASVFLNSGFATLRFNFRGTGNSTGMFDDGHGEQDDVIAAMAYLKENGYADIWLAGYSFGSKINASVVAKGCNAIGHVMVSPPVAFMSFDDIDRLPQTTIVVTGANDQIAPPDQIKKHLNRWKIDPRFSVIEGCDHFYSGSLQRLETILEQYLKE